MKSWWNYQRNAQGKYYLHSPFVYQFYTQILEPAPDEKCLAIDRELFKLKQNFSSINSFAYGEPSKDFEFNSTVSQVAKKELELKYGKVIYQLMKQSDVTYALDLSSASLGIVSAYMASAKPTTDVTTIEDYPDVQPFSKTLHQHLRLNNVTYLTGEKEHIVGNLLPNFPRVDAVFADCYHPFEECFGLLQPYIHSGTILIIRNIHETEYTETLWSKIKADEKVTTTIDLYRLGLVFFRKENLVKTDFILRY